MKCKQSLVDANLKGLLAQKKLTSHPLILISYPGCSRDERYNGELYLSHTKKQQQQQQPPTQKQAKVKKEQRNKKNKLRHY